MVTQGYVHREAFCLMKYMSDDGTESEMIWNSRDGVTPFVITMKSGKTGKHVDWHGDQCLPDYVPNPGERIFVDLTPNRALEIAHDNLQRWEEQGMDMRGAPTADYLANSYLVPAGQPDFKVVD